MLQRGMEERLLLQLLDLFCVREVKGVGPQVCPRVDESWTQRLCKKIKYTYCLSLFTGILVLYSWLASFVRNSRCHYFVKVINNSHWLGNHNYLTVHR